jgi:prephenate dehydrogenase
MVALVDQLAQHKSQRVTLEFDDGEVVEAVLLDVDANEHDDITFDVIAVRHAVREAQYDPNNVYVAPISTVKRVSPL